MNSDDIELLILQVVIVLLFVGLAVLTFAWADAIRIGELVAKV